jgi:MFS family permease
MVMEIQNKTTRNRVLAVLFVGVLMGALDIAVVGPALPAVQRSFSIGDRSLSWVFSIYVLFFLVGTPLMAKMADRRSRRSIYVADVLLFGLGSLAVALSPRFEVLLVGRAVQGFGAGGIFPIASAVIGDTFPEDKRGAALGLIGAVFGLAFIIGPILGGVLLRFGWQWLFLINLPFVAAVAVLALLILPRRKPSGRAAFDWPGMIVLGSALAFLGYGINGIRADSFLPSLASPRVLPFILGAAALLAVLPLIERKAADPILPLRLVSGRQRALIVALAGGAGIVESGLVYVPKLAVAALGVTSSTGSYLLLPLVGTMALASPLVGRLLDRIGVKPVIISGTLLLSAGFLLMSLYTALLPAFIAAGVIIGIGLSSLLGAPLRFLMFQEAGAEDRSAAQGVLNLNTSMGQLVGASAVSAVAASLGGGSVGYGKSYLVIAALGIVLFFIAWWLRGRKQGEAAPVSGADHTESPGLSMDS